ncbi:hypothetical protein M2322_002648 [Rhodoblastus acidophilus]|nr:hypothetical protein [Rhodoblastus acidophilus]
MKAKRQVGKPSFEQARSQYPHRYTMDHKPAWAVPMFTNGKVLSALSVGHARPTR